MKLIENILVVIISIGILVLIYSQWRKTKQLQKVYEELPDEEKKNIDKVAHLYPNIFAYAKPMNKGMWVSVIIGVGFFIWVLLKEALFL